MLLLNLATVAAIVACINAAPSPIKHIVHEERSIPAADWVKARRVDANSVLPIRIGLSQNNLEKGHDLLMEVSHPDSPKYGKYYTPAEIHDLFAPASEAVSAVRDWLVQFGIADSRIVHSDNKGWLAFDASAEEAERLFLTEYHEHEHKQSDRIRVGCDKYHVPEHLSDHIDYITPGLKLIPVTKRNVQVKRSVGKTLVHKLPIEEVHADFKTNSLAAAEASALPADVQNCTRYITVACWRALYGIPDASKLPALASAGNSLGIFEQGDYIDKKDLDSYNKQFAPFVPKKTYPIPALIDGGDNYQDYDNTELVQGEALLDIDIATALIYPQNVTLYQVDDENYGPAEVAQVNKFNTFLDALDGSYCTYTAYGETGDDPAIDPIYPDPVSGGWHRKLQCGVFTPTKVISASYGEAEVDLPINYSKRQCNEFMKLGMQGVSMLTSSGDYGVASFPNDGGDHPNANGCLGPEGKIFNPQYPGNCPYITSVGGTMLYPGQNVDQPESVMQVNLGGQAVNFSSSGGFSNYYPQPSYQSDAVTKYFATAGLTYPYYSEMEVDLNTTKGLYNRIGRGYPDVSANGAYAPFYVNQAIGVFFGASLSSPVFASVLTLLNEERTAVGKGPIGFVNPVLYAHPEVLNDITNGTSLGCNAGFKAVKGWDPVTGLGTPNYPKMKALWLSLP